MKWIALALAAAPSVLGHFTMQYLWVNGVDQGQNTYLRVPPSNNPVTDVTSNDIRCNVNGLTGSATGTKAGVPAGANITLEWHQHAQRTGEDPISGGHKGPVQVYIAKAPSTAASFDGSGAVWTKVYSSGLISASSQTWATDIVNANGGKHSFILPKSIPSGDYLIRGEIIALHVAQSYPGAQFYIGCAQISVVNGGSASPPKIALPGAYKGSDPGITVNIYNGLTNYTAPGGAVWLG
ncbi:putative endo-beta-1,4-glucanase D OS=Aspergillus niger (strain CBS 513,88 / FGSC A1513) GN=eglD PE=3 SV=1 [Rhizoctonia solani AG-1 IB]|uniref:AA9 family lytic polysaccharide monooxygenase n=1 Tax=Thanatephorus cucumeris (strain AG1-IB / isolate 7/3/14) TaxID=1108050 RepID=M5BRS5_THACB|nr:putative endo-beta-1,4-glucanase D Short=Endoglucanase D [Rhizoctonia solani AG-1 IB]CEL59597.1 putative endo-beta-1,4-glucanase D OS=Aspergillus niger (strain CBS 513,88 / FGSC A1513) GN=eglD PE=3 SV=1 [Rhizoctonia solani AG-1 IB]